jgi:hypothetical protein
MNRILFICFILLFIQNKAQDTLFFLTSEKLTVKLLEINPGNIIYKPYKSESAITYTIQKSDLNKVVYSNGVAEVFNNPVKEKPVLKKDILTDTKVTGDKVSTDTIVFNGGNKTPVKLITINISDIKYKMAKNPDGPTYTISKTEIKKIIFSTGLVQLFGTSYGQDYDIANAGSNKTQNLYDKGKQDALSFYRHKGGSVGVGCAALGCSPILGLIPAVAVSMSDPKRKNLGMPASAYSSNADYVNGYIHMASKIKRRRVWTGFGIGTVLYVAIVVIANSLYH